MIKRLAGLRLESCVIVETPSLEKNTVEEDNDEDQSLKVT